jgi:glucokinase
MSVTIGLELGAASVRALAVVDGTGHVTARVDRPFPPSGAPSAAAAAAAAVARDVGLSGGDPLGLAAVDPTAAETAAIVEALRKSFRLPAPVTSLGLAAATAETWCGAARGVRHLVTLYVGDDIAAGVILDGRPWLGAHGLAGSAAWLALNPVERQDYRQFGCLDAEISSRGIAKRLAWRVEAGDLSRVVEQAGGLEAVTARHVLDGARTRDGVAISVVRDTVRYIGMAIANLCAVVDPEMIVLGGAIAADEDLLLEPVRQECQRRLPPALFAAVRIVASPLGDAAAAIGAARLAATAAP